MTTATETAIPVPEQTSNPPKKDRFGFGAWIVMAAVAVAASAIAFGAFWPSALEDQTSSRRMLDTTAFFIRTLGLQIGLGVAFAAVLALALRQWWKALALLVLSAWACAPTLSTFWPDGGASSGSSPAVAGQSGLKLLSANLLAWNRTPTELADQLAASDADVILLQEYTPRWRTLIQPRFAARWPYACEVPQEDCFGVAVFSRRPFAEPPKNYLPIGETDNPQIRAVVEFGGRRMALYNIHLLPPIGDEYIRINRREFCDLAKLLEAEALPVAVCGDFNFTNQVAQAERLFNGGFRDGLDEGASGPQWTWPANGRKAWFPGIRIDHVYLRGPVRCAAAGVGPSGGSDHRPVWATLSWDRPE